MSEQASENAEAGATAPPPEPTEPKRLLDITRDEVRTADDKRIEIVPVDEWKRGAVVYVHTPSIGDKDYLENVIIAARNADGTKKASGKETVRAAFVAMCARNSKGDRIFTAEDVEWLRTKSIAPMDRIFEAMVTVGIVTAKDVDEIAKNSGPASNDIS